MRTVHSRTATWEGQGDTKVTHEGGNKREINMGEAGTQWVHRGTQGSSGGCPWGQDNTQHGAHSSKTLSCLADTDTWSAVVLETPANITACPSACYEQWLPLANSFISLLLTSIVKAQNGQLPHFFFSNHVDEKFVLAYILYPLLKNF